VCYLALLQNGRVGKVDTLADTKAYLHVDSVGDGIPEIRQSQPVVGVGHVDIAHRVNALKLTARRHVTRLSPLTLSHGQVYVMCFIFFYGIKQR